MTLKNAVATEYAKTYSFAFYWRLKMADIIINNDKCDNCRLCRCLSNGSFNFEDEKLTINEPDDELWKAV